MKINNFMKFLYIVFIIIIIFSCDFLQKKDYYQWDSLNTSDEKKKITPLRVNWILLSFKGKLLPKRTQILKNGVL